MIGSLLLAVGGISFFGTSLSAIGAWSFTFEWPIGHASQLIQLPGGGQLAAHIPSGRIQIYDPSWKYLVGWNVEASGGDFKVKVVNPHLLEVLTRRGYKRFFFKLDGSVVKSDLTNKVDYEIFAAGGSPGPVPTPLILCIFANPIIAWAVALVGGIMLVLSDPERFLFRRKGSRVDLGGISQARVE